MKNLHEVWYALKDLHQQGQVADADYYKGLLCIAKEWTEIDEPQEARDLVVQVTEQYLSDVMPGQMDSDPDFHQVVYTLATALKVAEAPGNAEEMEIDLAILRGPAGKA